MPRSMLRCFSVLLVTLLIGCSAMWATDAPPLAGSTWLLSALPGRTLLSDTEVTLGFDGGRAQGSDGCNRFSAPYTTRGATIAVSTLGPMTQMACAPEVMKQGEVFIAALTGARTYRIEGGVLQLLDANAKVLATFAAQLQALAGTSWLVTGINNGRNAVVSTHGGSTVTMAFSADGRFAGSAGCNRYTGLFQTEGKRFRFVAPAATRKMCADPKLMEQEQAFLKALEAVTTMRIEGSTLEFRDAGGALQVLARREG